MVSRCKLNPYPIAGMESIIIPIPKSMLVKFKFPNVAHASNNKL